MNVIAKYTRSVTSSNLRDDEHHHSTEALAAVAMSGTLGNLLFRVKFANDHTSFHKLLDEWKLIVAHKAVSRRWPVNITPEKVAEKSLRFWLNDICESCSGIGYLPVPGTPVLSDTPCKECRGTKRKALDCKPDWTRFVEDMVETLNTMSKHAAGRAMRKISNEMTL